MRKFHASRMMERVDEVKDEVFEAEMGISLESFWFSVYLMMRTANGGVPLYPSPDCPFRVRQKLFEAYPEIDPNNQYWGEW